MEIPSPQDSASGTVDTPPDAAQQATALALASELQNFQIDFVEREQPVACQK